MINKLIFKVNREDVRTSRGRFVFRKGLLIGVMAVLPITLISACENIPIPEVIGNAQIEILSHEFIVDNSGGEQVNTGVVINIKNITDENIGKAVFNVKMYDTKCEIVDDFQQDAFDIKVGESKLVSFYPAENNDLNIGTYDIELTELTMCLMPSATGNDQIEITNHCFLEGNAPYASPFIGGAVDLAIKNISGKTISTVTFEAQFYDLEGNVIDTVQHEEYDLKPESSRAIYIVSDNVQVNAAGCYRVTIINTIMAD